MILEEVNKVFETEINALIKVKNGLDIAIVKAIQMVYECHGKIAVCVLLIP